MPALRCVAPSTKTRPWSLPFLLTILSWALAISALTGCASGTKRSDPPAPLPPTPTHLTVLCEPLPLALGSVLPMLWTNHQQVAASAQECALRFAALVQVVRAREAQEQVRYERATTRPPPAAKRKRWRFWRS